MNISTIQSMGVNCYLIQNQSGFFLVDTGFRFRRKEIESKLIASGCEPGQLKLILLTHADGDHAGNAVYFKNKFKTQVALHPLETEAASSGDLLRSRSNTRFAARTILKLLLPIVGIPREDRFSPDVELSDGFDLNEFGLDARVDWVPGHSAGSVSILTVDGNLFCGDLLTNVDRPGLNSNMDDLAAGKASMAKILRQPARMVFPGHGSPFSIDLLTI
jgi:glyoxylase-like metal-dependent hydrolase (beta-lactamase superfamily II)